MGLDVIFSRAAAAQEDDPRPTYERWCLTLYAEDLANAYLDSPRLNVW